jgi:uncharacterized protein (TIGR02118 family)
MIRVAVLYPNKADAKFDHDYYASKHIKMVNEKLTPMGMVKAEADKGIFGATPDAPPPYVAIGYLMFNTAEELQKAMAAHLNELLADIPNYTNIEPQMQVSECVT